MAAADLLLQHRALTAFLGSLQGVLTRTREPEQRIRALLEPFRHLLMEDFLAHEFRRVPDGPFRQYLIYRSSDRSVSMYAKVIAPGAAVPAHDHGAWGIRGVYQGAQRETVYQRQDPGRGAGHAVLMKVRSQRLRPGDVTGIVPPVADIHALVATSKMPSVSVMLLGADPGCLERTVFDVRARSARLERIGYANVGCAEANEP